MMAWELCQEEAQKEDTFIFSLQVNFLWQNEGFPLWHQSNWVTFQASHCDSVAIRDPGITKLKSFTEHNLLRKRPQTLLNSDILSIFHPPTGNSYMQSPLGAAIVLQEAWVGHQKQTKITTESAGKISNFKKQRTEVKTQRTTQTRNTGTLLTRQTGSKQTEDLVYIHQRAGQQWNTGETHKGNHLWYNEQRQEVKTETIQVDETIKVKQEMN